MGDMLLDKTSTILGKVLDGTSARQRVFADNIANAETPGYTRNDLPFEALLRDKLAQLPADPDVQLAAIHAIPLDAKADTQTPANADGNNVEIDREMAEMAKNVLQYETTAQLLTMKLKQVQNAIHEGRG